MVVNHDEQVKVYSDIAKKLGITEKYKDVVSKASTFLNRHKDPDSVDVVLLMKHICFLHREIRDTVGKISWMIS